MGPANLYEDQESINLAAARRVGMSAEAVTYAQAAQDDQRNGAKYIDLDDVSRLQRAHDLGLKVIGYHGTFDNQVPWRGEISFYTRGRPPISATAFLISQASNPGIASSPYRA
jgi:hypothetical protein